jgi:hypothetical protein
MIVSTKTIDTESSNNSTSIIKLVDNKISDEGLHLSLIATSPNKNSTNYQPSENEINNIRLKYLEEKVSPLFLSIIKNEDFEFDQRCESINLVEENLKVNRVATQNWINKLYLQYFASDEKVLLSLLRVIDYFNRELFYPTGQTIALSALVHNSDEIKEMGVRIFENWGSIESLNILKAIKVDTDWLQKYINEVIIDLEKELCLY